MYARTLALGLVLIAYGTSVNAQAIPSGSRIRYEAAAPSFSGPPSRKGRGTLLAQEGDTLVIERRPADTVRVALSAIRQVHVWEGRSHLRGALNGLLVGVGSGLVLGTIYASNPRPGDELAVLAIPMLGSLGAVTGTLAGAVAGSARWRRVHLPHETRRP